MPPDSAIPTPWSGASCYRKMSSRLYTRRCACGQAGLDEDVQQLDLAGGQLRALGVAEDPGAAFRQPNSPQRRPAWPTSTQTHTTRPGERAGLPRGRGLVPGRVRQAASACSAAHASSPAESSRPAPRRAAPRPGSLPGRPTRSAGSPTTATRGGAADVWRGSPRVGW